MKKLLSILLILALVLSLSCVAFAAEDQSYDLSAAKLNKDLEVADGIDMSGKDSFTFKFVFNEGNSIGYDAEADASKMPAIADVSLTVGTADSGHRVASKALNEIFPESATAYPHAGVYAYTVSETKPSSPVEGMTYDEDSFTVLIYVKNGTKGLEYGGVIVKNSDDEKVDPTVEPNGTVEGFEFNNTYKEDLESDTGVLTVTKSITGAYADKTKTFPISVVLTLPSTATANDVAVATGATWTADTLTASADLADGGEIKFTKLPAGTTYTISETQDTLYQSKITGAVKTPDSAYVAGNRTDVEGAGPITEAGLTVTIENNREDIIPTGVIIHNLPYVLLVLVAIAGLVFLVMKKRAHNA